MSGRPKAYIDPPRRPAFALPVPPAGKKLISLAINESPFGCSPSALAAAEARLKNPHRYPDPSSHELRAAIAEVHGFDAARIICGNGSEELLDMVGRMFARPGDEIVMSQSGFFQFALVAARTGAALVRVPERNLVTDTDALLGLVSAKTKIVFLAVPNNPTGTVIPVAEIQRLHAALSSQVVLVLDLAYGEYLPPADLAALMGLDGENVIKTRTFSKAHGLAALRVGWAQVPEWMVPGLNLIRGVGNINAVAQAAAAAAVRDEAFVAEVAERTAEQREILGRGLARLGLRYVEGLGNFLPTRFPDGLKVEDFIAEAMAAHGIWLRPVGEPGFANWSRIGIGTAAETLLLLSVLERFLMTGRRPLK
ncbi:MAG TPA: histidinol-phosphate transaminase [Aestuariivirga sp.]|nr:histidinol-phosphate transaminase [Aestuariivirga sp.]